MRLGLDVDSIRDYDDVHVCLDDHHLEGRTSTAEDVQADFYGMSERVDLTFR